MKTHCIRCKRVRIEENKNEFEQTNLKDILRNPDPSLEHEYLYCKAGYGCFDFLPKKAS